MATRKSEEELILAVSFCGISLDSVKRCKDFKSWHVRLVIDFDLFLQLRMLLRYLSFAYLRYRHEGVFHEGHVATFDELLGRWRSRGQLGKWWG